LLEPRVPLASKPPAELRTLLIAASPIAMPWPLDQVCPMPLGSGTPMPEDDCAVDPDDAAPVLPNASRRLTPSTDTSAGEIIPEVLVKGEPFTCAASAGAPIRKSCQLRPLAGNASISSLAVVVAVIVVAEVVIAEDAAESAGAAAVDATTF